MHNLFIFKAFFLSLSLSLSFKISALIIDIIATVPDHFFIVFLLTPRNSKPVSSRLDHCARPLVVFVYYY